MALVKVKPIDKQRWHGKAGKDSFYRPLIIRASVNSKFRQYNVKLTEQQIARLQADLGVNLSMVYNPDAPHPFWDLHKDASVKLENKVNVFNSAIPHEEIKIGILKGSPLVAPSLDDTGEYPSARFVIFDEAEEEQKQVQKFITMKNFIIKMRELPHHKKENLLRILTGENYKNNSDEFVEMKISEWVNMHGMHTVDRILQRSDEENYIHGCIIKALYKGILRSEGKCIYFHEEMLGYDTDLAVAYLLDDKNQQMKHHILGALDENKPQQQKVEHNPQPTPLDDNNTQQPRRGRPPAKDKV